MKVVDRGDGQYAIQCTYFSRALVEHSKAVPGVRWDAPTRSWMGYADAVAAVAARLRHAGLRLDTSELPPPDAWREARSPFLFSTKNLREYQIEGVRFLIARSGIGALLADGMRLGKTCQSLCAARAFKQRTLVVCQSHVVGVWAGDPESAAPGEIVKWWPDAWLSATARGEALGGDGQGVVVLEGIKPVQGTLDGCMVVVCSYDILYAWVEALKDWGVQTLIVDECQCIQGYDSRRSKSVRALAEIAARRMFLSGTPMTSRPRDLHNVLDTLCPGRFGYFFTHNPQGGSFSRLYCDAHQKTVGKGPESKTVWDFSGSSNLSAEKLTLPAIVAEESLHARLSYLMLRRVKSQVDSQLPSLTRQVVDVRIPPAKMITPTGSMLSDRGALRAALDLSADGKLKSVVALLATHAEEGEKVVAFCYRRAFAEALCDALQKKNVQAWYTHGGLTQARRDERIQAARESPSPCVLCATIDTTSTGIDLSFASVAVFGEFTWEPHELIQAEARLYRFGVESKSLVQYVVARGTGDELVLRAVISKLDDFEAAVGTTGETIRKDLAGREKGEAGEGLKKLTAALVEMQKGAPEKPKRKARA